MVSTREVKTAYMRKWRAANREKHNAAANKSHHKHKHKYVRRDANNALLRNYGITLEEKERRVSLQGGKCLLCLQEFPNSIQTHVDHDHKTGIVRGILCGSCNTKLGWFEQNRERILEYVK